ncbi:hypothetical protein N9850_12075, partial [Granulosicoccus sp.]
MLAPIFVILMSSTHQTQTLQQEGLQWIPGGQGLKNYSSILGFQAGYFDEITPLLMLLNSLVVAIGVATLTTVLSFLAAYALVFFNIKFGNTLFWLILATLLFP